MAITRTYETKEECLGLFMEQEFDRMPSWVVTEQDCWFENWRFEGIADGEDTWMDVEEGEYGETHAPMWDTWFIPSDWVTRFVNGHPETVADCGFTLIFNDGVLFALGVDGAGYSFKDAHFTRLYDAMGIKWHE